MRRGDWALFDRKRICDISDRNSLYLSRLYIVETPWFGVFLHAIYRKDHDRALHDHPWSFVSVVLRGGYEEHWRGWWRPTPTRSELSTLQRGWGAGSIHRMGRGYRGQSRGELHRISTLWRVPTWTLVVVGPRRTEWGYSTPTGWVESHVYHRTLGLTENDDDF